MWLLTGGLLLILVTTPYASESPGVGTSSSFSFDSREIAETPSAISTPFAFDTRQIDGLRFWGESPPVRLDSGGGAGIPVVNGISPSPVTGSDQRQWIAIRGSGFRADSRVVLRTGNEIFTIPTERTAFVSGEEILVYVNVTTEEAEWTAQVTGPSGLASAAFAFQVGVPMVRPDGGLDFGTVTVGTTSEKTFVVRNTGSAAASGTVTVNAPFAIIGEPTYSLAPGEEATVTIRFGPASEGHHERTAFFTLRSHSIARQVGGRAIVASPELGSVAGTVRGADPGGDAPLGGIRVELSRPSGGFRVASGQSAYTDAAGRYSISGVAPGQYTVTAPGGTERAAYEALANIANVTAGSTAACDFRLEPRPGQDPESPALIPVVLVRGLGDFDPYYWQSMKETLLVHGLLYVWDPNEGMTEATQVIDGQRPISTNAASLMAFLKGKVAEYESARGFRPSRLNFVAHSMGGLITRKLLSDASGTDALPPPGDVFMLGTPNAGSLLANVGQIGGGAAMDDLTTWYVRGSFSEANPWPDARSRPRLRLFLVAGTEQNDDPKLEAGSWSLKRLGPPEDWANDGAVTRHSVEGSFFEEAVMASSTAGSTPMVILPREKRNCFQTRRVHPVGLQQTGLNHSELTYYPTIRSWVAGILSGDAPGALPEPEPPEAPEATVFTKAMSTKTEEETGQPESIPLQFLEIARGGLAPASNLVWRVDVDSGRSLSFAASWTGTGTTFRISTPDGRDLGPESAGVEPGLGYTESHDPSSGAMLAAYEITNAPTGEWAMALNASAAPAATDYSVHASDASHLGLVPMTSARVGYGQDVLLRAAIATSDPGDTNAPPTGAMTARITAPDGAGTDVALLDDGAHGDDGAGDGIYGAIVPAPALPGDHRAIYRFTGSRAGAGLDMQRAAEAPITVGEGAGYVAGEVTARRVNIGDTGLTDMIEIECQVAVAAAGDYALSGVIEDRERGIELRAARPFARDSAGAATVMLHFARHQLPPGETYGPFVLKGLHLFRRGEADAWLDTHESPMEIAATLENTEPRLIYLAGDLAFGDLPAGQSLDRQMTIHNHGYEPLDVSGLSAPPGFTAAFSGVIEADSSQAVTVTFAPTAEQTYSGILSAAANASAGSAALPVSGNGVPTPIGLDEWLASFGVPPGSRDPADDPNADGVPNLLAYLFRIDPMASGVGGDPGALPRIGGASEGGRRYLVLTYRRNRNASEVTEEIQISATLAPGSWLPATPASTEVIGTDPATGDPVVRAKVDVTGMAKAFLRIKAETLSGGDISE